MRFNSQRDGILLWRWNRWEYRVGCFNSQRDGILPKQKKTSKKRTGRFNSQRDGILLKAQKPIVYAGAFQFPTGWNSTMNPYLLTLKISCFNSQRDGILLINPISQVILMSFNSQRDGILLKIAIEDEEISKSFNSQRDGILHLPNTREVGAKTRFNSQRDGILQKVVFTKVRDFDGFQFPTGWNSTVCYRFPAVVAFAVSIPNGMEFYRARKKQRWNFERVSIPNGMEFYKMLLAVVLPL